MANAFLQSAPKMKFSMELAVFAHLDLSTSETFACLSAQKAKPELDSFACQSARITKNSLAANAYAEPDLSEMQVALAHAHQDNASPTAVVLCHLVRKTHSLTFWMRP